MSEEKNSPSGFSSPVHCKNIVRFPKQKKRLADGINERQSIFNQARILLRLVPFLLTR
jgi:hypothetical protein